LNYPNPFSTRTQFVYTLTGETPPQYFRIQIMTVSGKVVREITQEELGVLKIGTHKTDYAWDGRDEYGNQLANGVYLYRVIAKGKDGKAFEGYEGDMTNDLFKKGIGKLVILR
jgi:flagellar hook assembly protein FlgD